MPVSRDECQTARRCASGEPAVGLDATIESGDDARGTACAPHSRFHAMLPHASLGASRPPPCHQEPPPPPPPPPPPGAPPPVGPRPVGIRFGLVGPGLLDGDESGRREPGGAWGARLPDGDDDDEVSGAWGARLPDGDDDDEVSAARSRELGSR